MIRERFKEVVFPCRSRQKVNDRLEAYPTWEASMGLGMWTLLGLVSVRARRG